MKRNTSQLLFAFIAIATFFAAVTLWWLSLANQALQLWSIILFFLSILMMFSLVVFFLFDVQKRIEKLELIYKIKTLEGDPVLKEIDIKIVSLNNWEKRIIKHLKEHEGELTQTEIRDLTGLSRSNLSKHLNSLEEKQIIRKDAFKRTNKIFLVKNLLQ